MQGLTVVTDMLQFQFADYGERLEGWAFAIVGRAADATGLISRRPFDTDRGFESRTIRKGPSNGRRCPAII